MRLTELQQGLRETWEELTEGWKDLYHRASSALVRYRTPGGEQRPEGVDPVYAGTGWGLLASDMIEDDDSLSIRIEAPGMSAEDFDLFLEGDQLRVRGSKSARRDEQRGHYHFLECAYGEFERLYPLPAVVDPEQVEARYRNGVLQIRLEKSNASSDRRVKVQHG